MRTTRSSGATRFSSILAAGAVAVTAVTVRAEDPAVPRPAAAEAADGIVADGDEIVVTATRGPRSSFEVPWAVSVAGREELAKSGSFVAAKALSRRNAAIWFDERTSTTTDLIIRGFCGFNLLALVDGNTLSTLWGEGGFGADDMYGKIDPETVERIEVVRGPAAAIHGSNALGAVVNFVTRAAPTAFPSEGSLFGGRIKLTGGTVDEAGGLRLEGWTATPDLRVLVGGSARDWDHVEGGGDLGELFPSDGRERNWDVSADWRTSPGRTLRFTVQDVHRDHLKRYYRPFQDNEADREAFALFWTDENRSDVYDRFEARLYRQEKVDRRRWFDTGEVGEARTETWQGGLTLRKSLGGGHDFTAGLALEIDDGDSPDDEQFTIVRPGPERRDSPLSTWTDAAVFVLDEWRVSDEWSLIGSARLGRMKLETDADGRYVPSVGTRADAEMSDSTSSLTGGLGAVWRVRPDLHLVASWSRGFRQNAPNFGLRQLGDGILVPNDLLDPTTSDNFEIGAKGRGEGFRWETFVYRSQISNWQGGVRPAMFNGAAWLDFNGNGTRDASEGYIEQVNGGDAHVVGIEMSAEANLHTVVSSSIPRNWTWWGSLARNVGRVDATDLNPLEEPLRHTQPTRLLTGLRWDDVERPSSGLYVELVADVVNRFHDIPSDRRTGDIAWLEDPQDGSSSPLRSYDGTPGYTVFSLYAGMKLSDRTTLRVGVENLTDKKYRSAHSRMDAPGVGVTASLEILF